MAYICIMSYQIDKEEVSAIVSSKDVGKYYKEHIVRYATDIIAKDGKMPSAREIHEATGIHIKTVYSHLPLKLNEITPSLSSHTADVLAGLANQAKKGNVSAAKLWLQVVEGWNEKSVADSSKEGGKSKSSNNISVVFQNFEEPKKDNLKTIFIHEENNG